MSQSRTQVDEHAHSSELILYAYTFRSRAERVLWTLEELNLKYSVIRLNPFKKETIRKELQVLNPNAQVPILVHDGRVLTESLAIMEYLAARFDGHHLLPSNLEQTYRFRHAISYGTTELEAYLWLAEQSSRLNQRYQWPNGTEPRARELLSSKLLTVFEWLEHSPYIAGDDFSLADIYFYHLFSWCSQHLVEPPPAHVCEYLLRLEQRPRFPACVKNSDSE